MTICYLELLAGLTHFGVGLSEIVSENYWPCQPSQISQSCVPCAPLPLVPLVSSASPSFWNLFTSLQAAQGTTFPFFLLLWQQGAFPCWSLGTALCCPGPASYSATVASEPIVNHNSGLGERTAHPRGPNNCCYRQTLGRGHHPLSTYQRSQLESNGKGRKPF